MTQFISTFNDPEPVPNPDTPIGTPNDIDTQNQSAISTPSARATQAGSVINAPNGVTALQSSNVPPPGQG